jgi:hypothetical protein
MTRIKQSEPLEYSFSEIESSLKYLLDKGYKVKNIGLFETIKIIEIFNNSLNSKEYDLE